MRYLIVLLLLAAHLAATKILSYNVYDRTERVDIMLTFDTPYEGVLRESRQNGKIIIKLDKASLESPKLKNLASPYLSKLTLTPIGNQTQIIAKVSPSVVMHAAKTSDAYGLRLRFEKATPSSPQINSAAAAANSPLPTKPEGTYNKSYSLVIAVLIIGILILLWLKRKLNTDSSSTIPGRPWLFNVKKDKKDGVKIRFQKSLDTKNRVVMMDYGGESYLVLIGNSNILLDKFHGTRPVTEGEFESMLESKNRELDSFLQIDQQKKEALDSYKEKASGINFDV